MQCKFIFKYKLILYTRELGKAKKLFIINFKSLQELSKTTLKINTKYVNGKKTHDFKAYSLLEL